METKSKAVAYIRVSTKKQGVSGLGLHAQKIAIKQLAGHKYQVIKEFREIESGKNSRRPVMIEALAYCKKHKAVLLIAKLDRLSRDVHFISGLMKGKVEFKAADMPDANKFNIHIMASFAEYEGGLISARTKEALAKYKGKGILGKNGAALAKANKLAAFKSAKALQPQIEALRARNIVTVQAIAKAIDKHPTQVQRILTRLKQENGN